jgi:hypothetical protein
MQLWSWHDRRIRVCNNGDPLVLYIKEEVEIYEANKTKVQQLKEYVTESLC